MLSQHGHDSPESLYLTCYLRQDTSSPLPSPHPILSIQCLWCASTFLTTALSISLPFWVSVLCLCSLVCLCSIFTVLGSLLVRHMDFPQHRPLVLRRCPSQLAAHFEISLCRPGSLFSVFRLSFSSQLSDHCLWCPSTFLSTALSTGFASLSLTTCSSFRHFSVSSCVSLPVPDCRAWRPSPRPRNVGLLRSRLRGGTQSQ